MSYQNLLSPEIMLAQKENIDKCIEKMEEDRAALLDALSAYSAVMKDNVQQRAKTLINAIQTLVSEMQQEIKERAQPVADAARLQIRTETEADLK